MTEDGRWDEQRADLEQARVEVLRLRDELDAARHQQENLEVALQTARTIGTAIGILMALRKLTPDEAFDQLRTASQHGGRKLRAIAEDVVRTGEIPAGDPSGPL